MQRRVVLAIVLVGGLSQRASAASEHAQLNEQQRLGWRLFETSCGICHTRPTLVAGLYGPELNKETAGGNDEVIRGIVTNGTPRMPAFRYTYDPAQIAAIAAYVRTLPVGNQAPPIPAPVPRAQP
jgi:mono/diheme cytochrome c family protein